MSCIARRTVWAWIFVLNAIAFGAIADAAPPASKPSTSAGPSTRMVRRRVVVMPSTQRVSNPIPGIASQELMQKRIREIYETDYNDTSFNGRRNLAKRLIESSSQTMRDSDAKYVFLKEARDIAVSVGDVTTAFEAIDEQVKAFPFSKLSERIEVMKLVVPTLVTMQSNLAAVSICMDLVDQCVVEGDYDRADLLLGLAAQGSRQGKSLAYAKWADARATSIRPARDAYDIARPAENTLAQHPNDPDANLVMGKFVAFIKGDFDAGLNMLEKSSDPAMAELAGADLNNPEAASAQFKLASTWWDLAESQAVEFRPAMQRRAGFWYRKSARSLDGLDRALAERRLLELNPPIKPGAKKKVERAPDALMLQPSRWYRASIAEVNWETAQRLCQEAGGQLVSIETRAEGDLMSKLAKGRSLWLGASVDELGRWKWLTGTELFYSNWASGEPVNFNTDSHPVTGINGPWRIGAGKAGFICEWRE